MCIVEDVATRDGAIGKKERKKANMLTKEVLGTERGYGVSMKPRAVRSGIIEFDRVLSYNGFIVE